MLPSVSLFFFGYYVYNMRTLLTAWGEVSGECVAGTGGGAGGGGSAGADTGDADDVDAVAGAGGAVGATLPPRLRPPVVFIQSSSVLQINRYIASFY